jgi:mRNA interferase MazF
MARSRVPEAGDIAWLTFSPQIGHEQGGHRPALVLSPAAYNGKTSMMICCAITTQIKGYPFEVLVSKDPPSAILADHIRTFDWRARGAKRTGRVPDGVLAEVRAKLRPLIGA